MSLSSKRDFWLVLTLLFSFVATLGFFVAGWLALADSRRCLGWLAGGPAPDWPRLLERVCWGGSEEAVVFLAALFSYRRYRRYLRQE